jgi:hypothetical protein
MYLLLFTLYNNLYIYKIKSHTYIHTTRALSPKYCYDIHRYIHRYHSRFIPEGVAEVSQIFLRDTQIISYYQN